MHRIQPTYRIRIYNLFTAMIALALGSMPSGCSFGTSTITCDGTGLLCAEGQICAFDGKCAFQNGCGNNKLNLGEQCDDGNLTSGDDCDENCTITGCGNGIVTDGEACDDGNRVNGDGCDSNCKPTGCHNGIPTEGEECDDGNKDDDDDCVANCIKARCGDGFKRSHPGSENDREDCDDGDQIVKPCKYEESSCTVCNDTCHEQPGVTSACGDGIVQSEHEVCDDGNRNSCGTCSANCKANTLGYATGQITVIDSQSINYGPGNPGTFTLNDGINQAETFEFTMDGSLTAPSNVPILVGTSPQSVEVVRFLVRSTINNRLLSAARIIASEDPSSSSVINLTHELATGLGNQSLSHTIQNVNFKITPMANGGGADCAPGIRCMLDVDCRSNKCLKNPMQPTKPGDCQ